MRIAISIVLALAAASACSKKKEEKKAEPTTEPGSNTAGSSGSSGSATATTTGSAAGSGGSATTMAGSAGSAAGSGDAAATMTHHAGNCPSTVADSTTKADVKGKSVVVTITSDNKDAVPAIQKRTDELIKDRLAAKEADAHDQRGTHGGRIGICPVHIPEGATAEAKHVANGVTVTITPKDHLDDLKKEVDDRIGKAAQWVKDNIKSDAKGNQGGTGGGKNNEGMNHSGSGDSKGMERKGGSGKGTGGGGGKGTGKGNGGGK